VNRPAPATLSLRVPFTLRKNGGRTLVITPDGTTGRPLTPIDSALVKAVARAHRWQRMLESGEFSSMTELAEAEKVNRSYVCRVLRLTLLAPDIVEAILVGRQGPKVTLARVLEPFPMDWEKQRLSLPSA
jgi:hypothetical protein